MKTIATITFIILCICIFSISSSAQDYFMSGHFTNLNEKYIYYKSNNTLLRPAWGAENELFDSLIFCKTKDTSKNLLIRKLLHEHLIQISNEKYSLFIDPIIDFRLNHNSKNDKRSYLNTRGYNISGNLLSKVYFNTSFYENQGNFPEHITEFYRNYRTVPGYGIIKANKDTTVFDFANSYGTIAYTPIKQLHLAFGYDRLFAGDGYRSMVLSDFSAPYTFAKATVNIANWEYSTILAKTTSHIWTYTNINNKLRFEESYTPQYISYNFLTFSIKDYFKMTLFNALNTHKYGTYPNLTGLTWLLQDKNVGIFYGQISLTLRNRESAFQIGYKSFDLTTIKNLYFQVEFNKVNNGYSWAFFNHAQSLMHPCDGGVTEILSIISYSFYNFEILGKFNHQKQKNYNIYPITEVIYIDGQIIYHINKANRLQIFAGTSYRQAGSNYKNTFMNFGVRTALRYNSYDF